MSGGEGRICTYTELTAVLQTVGFTRTQPLLNEVMRSLQASDHHYDQDDD